jgi:dihydrofolate reductase
MLDLTTNSEGTPVCHSSASTTSRSRSTDSAPVKDKALRHISVTPAIGCTKWMFATRWWQPGGSGGVDDAFVQRHDPGIGAEIMGAGKFGHPGWHEDPGWKGAWGPNPPFHTPVFVLTHHPRPSIEMEGGTTFHFIDASPAEALEAAREAADGQDIRIGGGATMIRDFLAAGLIDHMHVVVVPILLGRGMRLWDGLEGLETNYKVETVSSPGGVTHVTFTRVAA